MFLLVLFASLGLDAYCNSVVCSYILLLLVFINVVYLIGLVCVCVVGDCYLCLIAL